MGTNKMSETKSTFFIGDILGSKIVTAEGKKVGHVADLQLTKGPEYAVTALFYGGRGLLHRWYVLTPFVQMFGLRLKEDTIPWEVVERIEHKLIRLKPGWQG